MFRKLIFQTHWLLGITAGFVLAIMGVTGALLSFEEEIVAALSPSRVTVPAKVTPLLPDMLVARLREQRPEVAIEQIRFSSDPSRAVQVRVQQSRGHGHRGVTYMDPYTGSILGASAGASFFSFVEELHRFLALPPAPGEKSSSLGRQITGIAALSLVFFAISGLYLRWPRKPLNWRSWFVLDLRRTSRNLYRELHIVIGTWVLIFYLLAALTGLTWSYGWYRQAATAALGGTTEGPFDDHGPPELPSSGTTVRDAALARNQSDATSRGAAVKAAGWDGHIGPPSIVGTGERADRDGASGRPQESHEATKDDGPLAASSGAIAPPKPTVPFDGIWRHFLRLAGPHYGEAGISMPRGDGPVRVDRPLQGGFHDGIMDQYLFDSHTGALIRADLAADRPLGRTITGSVLAFHSGAFLGLTGRILMALAGLCMPLFLVTGLLLYFHRRARKRRGDPLAATSLVGPNVESELLVIHASQTGGALHLAGRTAAAFAEAGKPVRLLPISSLEAGDLHAARLALFIVSTYGEGAPPDDARTFVKRNMAEPSFLTGLHYAVLALGDREYPAFCQFGHDVDAWLFACGAQRLFDPVEVDGEDAAAEKQWVEQLSALGATVKTATWEPEPFNPWLLARRTLLNEGSLGGSAYHLRLAPLNQALLSWQPGDIAEIRPCNDPAAVGSFLKRQALDGDRIIDGRPLKDHLARAVLPLAVTSFSSEPAELVSTLRPLPTREYSIASISYDGSLDLLVRQVIKPDGLGLGSGWLTRHLPLAGGIDLRIRANPNFHRPGDMPMILIGNGTGIAGLRAHLRESARSGKGGHWLLFGERSATHDAFFRDEIEDWLKDGTLARFDAAWSRDDLQPCYVQHLLQQNAAVVQAWVTAGAAIMVCGSLEGMALGVGEALSQAVGSAALEALVDEGRYRRDVY
jgi:sulfite reductase (NADPH) flavoprotein alpha-component